MIGKLNPKIIAASAFGLLLVGGSFWMSPIRNSRATDPLEQVVAGPAPERTYIDVTDTDADGILDWKETIPNTPEWLITQQSISNTSGTTTRTHTEAVAVEMLERMMRSNMVEGFGDTSDEIVARSSSYIETLAIDTLYTNTDIVTSANTTEAAVRAYGNTVAGVTFANAIQKNVDDEITILERAMESQDPETLKDLALIAAADEAIVKDLLTTPVPVTLAKEHLDLINAANAIVIDVRGFEQVFADPLYALVRIRRYEEDLLGLYQAIVNLYLAIDAQGIEWTEADTASRFIKVE